MSSCWSSTDDLPLTFLKEQEIDCLLEELLRCSVLFDRQPLHLLKDVRLEMPAHEPAAVAHGSVKLRGWRAGFGSGRNVFRGLPVKDSLKWVAMRLRHACGSISSHVHTPISVGFHPRPCRPAQTLGR